jgi:hypothetical protein
MKLRKREIIMMGNILTSEHLKNMIDFEGKWTLAPELCSGSLY